MLSQLGLLYLGFDFGHPVSFGDVVICFLIVLGPLELLDDALEFSSVGLGGPVPGVHFVVVKPRWGSSTRDVAQSSFSDSSRGFIPAGCIL
jgi:hypothetical protein